jgi:hypothetical protein
MKDPREFSSMDDSPTNTGTFGNDKDLDEVMPRYLMFEEEDPTEDCWDYEDNERFD